MPFYEWTWTKEDEFLQNLRELVKPVILAEGYDLFSEDAGKQVYVRGEESITRKIKFWGVPNKKLHNATRLVVAYVLTPTRTFARFTWENPYCDVDGYQWRKDFLNEVAFGEATRIYEYLQDWYNAVAESNEQADPPSLRDQ